VCALLLSLDLLFPPDLTRVEDLSREIFDRQGKLLKVYLAEDDRWRMKTGVNDVPPFYLKGLLAFEDRRFYYHPGVDPFALARAITQTITHGRVISGASTITMQTVRLLVRRPSTLMSKLTQMIRALQLEWRYSKEDILGLYLTLAPFGGNIEGVRAASWAWFGKPAVQLTPAQSALLVALPQAPERLRPDRFENASKDARNKVLSRMVDHGVLSDVAATDLREAPFRARRHAMPSLAAHFSHRLVREQSHSRRYSTTLERDLQKSVRDILRLALTARGPHDSGAALVVDLKTREFRAYVASPDSTDPVCLGAIDMVRALRSPGSTLKPFIYGAAFEEGWLHPLTRIDDQPRRFGDYVPANFSRTHVGDVTAAQALQWSLNVPAVAVLERLGPRRFVHDLRQVGARLHFPAGAGPGLSVALGGVGMSLESLTRLYATLGVQTQARSAVSEITDVVDKLTSRTLFGESANWYVAEILKYTPRPGNEQSLGHIALKTGTSYGYRDAWAFGFGVRYAVGVWTGRVDGTPVVGSTGSDMAAPLLFSIFALLEPQKAFDPSPPEGVLRVHSTKELPRGLRALDAKSLLAGQARRTMPLKIVFPPDRAVVELKQPDGRFLPLVLEALGGDRPLTWWVNKEHLERGLSDGVVSHWRPDGLGFVNIMVRDRWGEMHAVTVQIR